MSAYLNLPRMSEKDRLSTGGFKLERNLIQVQHEPI